MLMLHNSEKNLHNSHIYYSPFGRGSTSVASILLGSRLNPMNLQDFQNFSFFIFIISFKFHQKKQSIKKILKKIIAMSKTINIFVQFFKKLLVLNLRFKINILEKSPKMPG